MSMRCTVCARPDRQQIDLDLVTGDVSWNAIASKYGVNHSTVWHHAHRCIGRTVQANRKLADMLSAENLLLRLSELDAIARDLLGEAHEAGDIRAALMAVRESRETIFAYARIGQARMLAGLNEAIKTDAPVVVEPDPISTTQKREILRFMIESGQAVMPVEEAQNEDLNRASG